ncbi:hypothetical protein AQJ46_26220 [Streptomyces canus]|uniref:DUF2207 domain-containing protein n=2 Tax=Streptomyces TaxID=1883 RepID=A0A117R1W6_9ACTN|nr:MULTISPECIES: DUF2207 domain-containing protein [Streptomyces]KUN66508.1 hypothetical protein AQJ46_26220 [Streptomyces canus]MDI5909265.1 DUF2207 domain-containing protein [Streptomyces sp. 12257]
MRSLIVMLVVLTVFGGVAALAQTLANKERVTSMWVGAEIRADGSARITEVIDYDFGHSGDSHGIFRDVPGSPFEGDDVRVALDGHKVPWEDTYGDYYRDVTGEQQLADRLKVGDPDRLVSGVHRYRIQYTLPEVVKGGKLAWDAVGTGWKVDRSRVEIHVVGAHGFTALRCRHGSWDKGKPCTAEQSEPGHLVVELDRLKGSEGLTLYATAEKAKAARAAALPAAPSGKAVGTTLPHPLHNGGLFLAVALACAALTVCALRMVGRDRLAGDDGRERRVEVERLARGVTPSAAPPEELTPAQGGILLTEQVDRRHKVAWLLTAASDGHLTIRGDEKHPVLTRHYSQAGMDLEGRDILRTMFSGRDSLTLGARDPWFRQGWDELSGKLENWRTTSGLWDTAAKKRVLGWGAVDVLALLLGFALVITGGILNGRRIAAGLPVLLAGAVVAGVGIAVAARSWELDRRTPRGTDLWLQVEAFRRYLADPSSRPDEPPVGEQADRYAAWAVALGVESAWERAVSASTARPGGRRRFSLDVTDVLLAAVVLSAASPPSSSGGSSSSGGGGSTSGDVGGGAGGGGGGSW